MTLRSLTFSVCLAAGITAAPALLLATSSPETSVFAKLEDFHAMAVKASSSASELATLSRTAGIGWESQADQWTALRTFINDMGRNLLELENLRESGTPVERDAIDRAEPLLKQMAGTTEAGINFVNNYRGNLWRQDYQKCVNNVAAESARLSTTVGQFIRLEDLRAREKHTEKLISSEAVD
jgi:hypothetical protein